VLANIRRINHPSGMSVLLVLECRETAQQYAPLLSALSRSGARRLLRSAWVFPDVSVESVEDMLKLYLPVGDGFVLTVLAGGHLTRPVTGSPTVARR
jgi:hypothetical protein